MTNWQAPSAPWCTAQMPADDERPDEAANGKEEPDSRAKAETRGESTPQRATELYGRGVRTALRNNATAYGFSISITAGYGLLSGTHSSMSALETIAFAVGAAIAFLVVGGTFLTRFPEGSLPEGGQVTTISGGIDVLSIVATVATAYGLSRVPGFAAWPLTGAGMVITYLLASGLDVLLARTIARHTNLGRSQ